MSPFMTCVVDPAVNVPAEAATSKPLFGVPLLLKVYVLVVPETTVVGPLIATIGSAVPVLWHIVQVEPLLPDMPEIPLGYACAGSAARQITATRITFATQRRLKFVPFIVPLLIGLGRGIPQLFALLGSTACPRADTKRSPNFIWIFAEHRPEKTA
jgi:hypothetical protein